jgi:hypothetical protein
MHLSKFKRSTSTINEALYAISWAHNITGVVNPCNSELVSFVKEGALRAVVHFVNKNEPITPEMLRHFSQLANLKRNNIIFYSDHVKLALEQSKIDVYRESKDVIISITDNATCPVHLLRWYLALANIEPDSTAFIFRGLTYCKCPNSYMLRKCSKLSYSTAREALLSALQSLGLDRSKFGLHSLRAGGDSTSASADIADRMFKKHGRWKSNKAKNGYVKE